MASQYPPKKNAAFTLYFTLYKNDGTVIANPGTITKKCSIDGGSVADITASITEEDTTYGQCSVVLSDEEMNGDAIWIYIVDDTSGCVPYTCTLYTSVSTFDEIKAKVDALSGGTGSITWTYTVLNSIDGVTPIDNVTVWVTSDAAGTNVLASGTTNIFGVVTFLLNAGTVYVWRLKNGFYFSNPDTETVS